MDVVRQLMAVLERGVCAEITYLKAGAADGESRRVVAPLKLVEGVDGLMIRSLQLHPQNGVRTFKVSQITEVRASTTPLGSLSSRVAPFLAGEIQPGGGGTKRSTEPRDRKSAGVSISLSVSLSTNAWRDDWFVQYLHALRNALLDLNLEPSEVQGLLELQDKLGLDYSQICAVHAYFLGQELLSISIDGSVDDLERDYVEAVQSLLSRLGWPLRS